MASNRPYRQAMPSETILDEIQAHTGTQFDPEVVNAFFRVVRKHGESIIVNSTREARRPPSTYWSEEKQAITITGSEQQLINRLFLDLRHQRASL